MNQDQHDVVGEDDSIGGGGGGDGEEEDGGGAVQQHPAGVGKPVGGFSQTSTTNPQSESNHPLPTWVWHPSGGKLPTTTQQQSITTATTTAKL